MKLKDLKKEFATSLSGFYPSEEITSFFAILSEKYLGLSRIDLALKMNEEVSEAISVKFTNAILRLKAYEPVQYIIGETEFYGLPFKVNKHCLIPRPETEELVDWIINDQKMELNNIPPLKSSSRTNFGRVRGMFTKPRTLLDIGTGSGCIAVSLAKNLSESKVSGLDFSSEALKIARGNAALNKVKTDFFMSDILSVASLPGRYHIMVSNPPYVRELEKKEMQPNVLRYEPESALFVTNNDPLLFYRKIAILAKRHLTKGGLLYLEINEYLSNELVHLLESLNFGEIILKKDIYGKDRMIRCTQNE